MLFRITCNITVPVCHFFTATVGDLFGDADDISSDEEAKARKSDAEDDEGGGSDRERQVNYLSLLINTVHYNMFHSGSNSFFCIFLY